MPDISVTQIVKTVESEVERVRQFVDENELSEEDLEKLLEAEKAASNRKEVLELLKQEIREQRISEEINKIDDDLEGVEELMEDYRMGEQENKMPQDTVLQLVGGTVDEMVDHLEAHSYSPEKLEELLDAEKTVKDRKTARRAIEREIEKARMGEDAENVVEDAERLESDMESLEEDIAETDFSTDDNFKQKLKNELDEIQNSQSKEEDDIDDLAEAIEEKESGEQKEEKSDQEDDPEPEEDREAENEEDSSAEESENDEEEESSEEDDVEETGEEDEESEEPEIEADEEEMDELEQKKGILEELDLEMSDEELENVSLGELKDLREEKNHREELINELSKEFDESMLRNASTSDLEKLTDRNLEDSEDDDETIVVEDSDVEEDEDEEVDEEKIKKEAQEELDMLMGASREEKEEEEDTGLSFRQRIDDTRAQIRSSLPFSRSEEDSEDSKKMDTGSVKELLESYRELESKEATVKTAHVMKAFLERKLDADREMTTRNSPNAWRMKATASRSSSWQPRSESFTATSTWATFQLTMSNSL